MRAVAKWFILRAAATTKGKRTAAFLLLAFRIQEDAIAFHQKRTVLRYLDLREGIRWGICGFFV